MKRFLIFTLLFPPIALVVFNAPDMVAGRFGLMNFTSLLQAYVIGIWPAWLFAALDRLFAARWPHRRIVATTSAAALLGILIALFLWGGEAPELFPILMLALVGAIPAGVCSWLSGARPAKQAA